MQGEAPYVPVAERSVRERDLRMRPHPRPADLLRVVPGMLIAQHAGGGKANQYFLRGFDADHGTDVALFVDGVPINLVSHAHGQGYADLNWLIPELVDRLDIVKGPYAARYGDFATAGAIDFVTVTRPPRSSLSVSGGMFDSYRVLAIETGTDATTDWHPLLAGEASFTNGPSEVDERYKRYTTLARLSHRIGAAGDLSLTLTSYAGGWHGSGQIPLREVRAGRLGWFGSIDPSEGGSASRHSVYATYRSHDGADAEMKLLAYLVASRLNIFSNFTFFATDPVNGDEIEQVDDRVVAGVKAHRRVRHRIGPIRVDTTWGLDVRHDRVQSDLHHDRRRVRLATRVRARVRQTDMGLYGQADATWTRWLRTVAGARLDLLTFAVDDTLATSGPPSGSGVRERGLVSPKLSAVITPVGGTHVFVNVGAGFHSNDARGVVRPGDARASPTARAIGYELGARTRLRDRVDLAGSLWRLDLDHETVWVGDEGTTEARGATRRHGFEIEARARILSWLHADVDITDSVGRFVDLPAGEDRIPLAPELTIAGGVTAIHPTGWSARVGMRHMSDRPATEDGFLTATGFTLVDVTAAYATDRWELRLAVDNLLDARWREAQFATVTRLATEPPVDAPPPPHACPSPTRVATDDAGRFAGCEDLHFTPGAPLQATLTFTLYL